ncbi:MAG: hypothetical protein LIP01_02360 [Tannerellaceae bacterium]|nr:hypothetical protein [Tannerellaceae bacterium]
MRSIIQKNELYAYFQGYYNEYPQKKLDELGTPTSSLGGGYYQADKYEGGLIYYGFWLSYNDLFQVKRNNYYKIAITHIHGAGYPDPGGPVNPDVDPEDEETRGRLAVILESWIDDNQVITIGENPEDDSSSLNPGIDDWEEDDNQNETLEGGDGNNKFN